MNEKRINLSIISCVLLLVIPFIIYANSFNNQFIAGDDEEIVLRNQYLRSWHYLPNLFTENYKAGSSSISNFWRPFQLLVYSFIVQTFGIQPLPFHISSILFHSLCGVFLFLLFLKLLPDEIPPLLIFLGVLVWLVHPLHNEELAVTTGIASPAYLFGILLGLYAFIIFNENKKWYWFGLSVLGFIISLFSKESAIIFPALLLGMHLSGIKSGCFEKIKADSVKDRLSKTTVSRLWLLISKVINKHIVFYLLSLAYLILRLTALNFQNTLNFYGKSNVFTQHFSYRLYTLLTVIRHGLKIIFLPIGLHPEKSWPVYANFFSNEVFLSFLIVTALIGLAVYLWRKNPIFSFGIFWFFVSYLPMSNLLAEINALIWDHWFYAPSAGIILSILALSKNKLIRKASYIVLILAVGIFSYMTVERNQFFKDTEARSRLILKYEPNSAKTWTNLAIALAEKGEYKEAVKGYKKTIEISDIYPAAHHDLANAYFEMRKLDLAEKEYWKALDLDKNFYYSYLGMGKLYLYKGDKRKAVDYFKKALEIYPYLPKVKKLISEIEK